jgi:hypothetical protein
VETYTKKGLGTREDLPNFHQYPGDKRRDHEEDDDAEDIVVPLRQLLNKNTLSSAQIGWLTPYRRTVVAYLKRCVMK